MPNEKIISFRKYLRKNKVFSRPLVRKKGLAYQTMPAQGSIIGEGGGGGLKLETVDLQEDREIENILHLAVILWAFSYL